jgi:lysophospholipase
MRTEAIGNGGGDAGLAMRRAIPESMAFSHWRAKDGWLLRRFDWPAEGAARGSLLFLGGRGDFVEKYLEALHHWHGSGWTLAGFDWRGQGGSGRLLADPLICHLDSFDPLLDDLAAFVAAWRGESPAPHVVVAHSMGAHLTLRLLGERGGRIDAAVLLAPMIGLRGAPAAMIRALGAVAIALGRGRRRIWEGDIGNIGGRMTTSSERTEDKLWWKAHRPEIASGAPSWGWLGAASRSVLAARRGLGRLPADVPLLMLSSDDDPVIDVTAIRRLAARLPQATLRLFAGRSHELLREADATRLRVLDAIDAFFPERP